MGVGPLGLRRLTLRLHSSDEPGAPGWNRRGQGPVSGVSNKGYGGHLKTR